MNGALLPGALGVPGNLNIAGTLTMGRTGSTWCRPRRPRRSPTVVSLTATLTGTAFVTFAAGTYTPGTYAILTANGGSAAPPSPICRRWASATRRAYAIRISPMTPTTSTWCSTRPRWR